MKRVYFCFLMGVLLKPIFAGSPLPSDSLKKVDLIFKNESACFILKEKSSKKPEIFFGRSECSKVFPLGNRDLLPLAIVATDSGLIQDEKTLFKWDGIRYPNKLWNKDQFVTDWLQNQVTWVTDRLRLQLGASSIEKQFRNFHLEENASAEAFMLFAESFFLETLTITKSIQNLSKRFFYIGRYRYGSEVWGQKAFGENFASFTGHLKIKNQVWTFTTLLKPSPQSKEPLTAERAQALSMDVLTELGLF
ncbi:MAG: penicillin-binding transpeptidase domain-containing protein [Pseudomonadota bacterium]